MSSNRTRNIDEARDEIINILDSQIEHENERYQELLTINEIVEKDLDDLKEDEWGDVCRVVQWIIFDMEC